MQEAIADGHLLYLIFVCIGNEDCAQNLSKSNIKSFSLLLFWSILLSILFVFEAAGQPLKDDAARADLQSARIEYKHLQCDYRIKNPYNIYIGITNPDERLGD